MPRLKRFLSDVKDGRVPQTLWTYQEVGHTQEAKKELLDLMPFVDSGDVFETPKPTRLIRRILDLGSNKSTNDIVLDFFAGSGSAGAAVMAQNAADSGNRRFICVQLPTPLDSVARLRDDTRLDSLAAMTKERLRRAGKKIKDENPLYAGDLGFRVFKLDTSNIRTWDPEGQNLEKTLLDSIQHIKAGRTEADILYEVLLKESLDLCVPMEVREIAGKKVHSIGAGRLFACLETSILAGEAQALAHGMANWDLELAPARECTVLFRDSAFPDDVVKTNVTAILQQFGLKKVKSL